MPGWGVTPAIRVENVAEAIDFYTRVLGFTIRRGGPAEDHSAVTRGDSHLMIERLAGFYSEAYNAAITARMGQRSPTALYIEAEDLPQMYETAKAAGANIVDPLADREWGQAEFTVEDPSGNWLTFWKAPAPPA